MWFVVCGLWLGLASLMRGLTTEDETVISVAATVPVAVGGWP